MAARTTAPESTGAIEEIDLAPEAPATSQPTVDVDALIGNEPFDLSAIQPKEPKDDLLAHETDPDFAPDAINIGDESPFAKYLGRDIPPVDDEPAAPESVAQDATALDANDPGLAEVAKALGMSVEELTSGKPAPEATPEATTEAPAAIPPAVAAEIEALKAQVAALSAVKAEETQAEALAEQEAQVASARADYEATQRTAYDEQFSYLEDLDREEMVNTKVALDLMQWDAQVGQRLAESRAEAQAQEQAWAQLEAGYLATTEALIKANPTMAIEIAPGEDGKPGYRMADFLADTHQAAIRAYGLDDIGPFDAYAKAFEGGIKAVQTKAFQAGVAHAQARAGKGAAAPPPLSNKGGGNAPAAPKSGTSLKDLTSANMFAKEGTTARR